MIARIATFLVKLIIGFVALSLAVTILYKFVPIPVTATMLMDENGITKDWEPLADIDRNLVRAVIAAEDGKFCSHDGFDREAIETAIRRNAEGGRIRGGSTISQQTAKNAFLWPAPSWTRKGLEAGFTVLIEGLWSKRRVMEVYLNVAEFGPGVFGAEAAARHWFDRKAAELTLAQAARLAALLPSPRTRDAARPSAFVAGRARAIAGGAETIRAEGRDACVLG